MYKLSKVPPLEGLTPPVEEGEKAPSDLLLHHTSGLKSSLPAPPPVIHTSTVSVVGGGEPGIIHTSTSGSGLSSDRYVTSSSGGSYAGQSAPENLSKSVTSNMCVRQAGVQDRHKNIGGLVTNDSYRLLPEILMPPPPAPRSFDSHSKPRMFYKHEASQVPHLGGGG
jgi:hypothetical protein